VVIKRALNRLRWIPQPVLRDAARRVVYATTRDCCIDARLRRFTRKMQVPSRIDARRARHVRLLVIERRRVWIERTSPGDVVSVVVSILRLYRRLRTLTRASRRHASPFTHRRRSRRVLPHCAVRTPATGVDLSRGTLRVRDRDQNHRDEGADDRAKAAAHFTSHRFPQSANLYRVFTTSRASFSSASTRRRRARVNDSRALRPRARMRSASSSRVGVSRRVGWRSSFGPPARGRWAVKTLICMTKQYDITGRYQRAQRSSHASSSTATPV